MRASRVLIASACALALSACQQAAQQPPAGGETSGAGPADTAAGATPDILWNGGQAKTLDIQIAHPNGVVLQLTSLQSRPTQTAIGMRVINGRQRETELNRFPNNRNDYILLESGERLYLSPPATNTSLAIPAGQTFEGELVFLGRLPPVKAALLVLNEGGVGDNQYTSSPGFRIDLPLTASPGRANAPAAAGAGQ